MMSGKNIISIRIVAMFGVLFMHASFLHWQVLHNLDVNFFNNSQLSFSFFSVAISLFKFSSIIFFLISGYLFETNKRRYTDFKKFVLDKYHALLKPYLVIFFIPVCLFLLLVQPYFGDTYNLSFTGYLKNITSAVFLSNYWFVPVLLLYFILNFFIPYKWLKVLFPLSILITLSYSLNLYLNLISTVHTLSFIGFLSFFFLGRMQVHKVYKPVKLHFKILLVILFLLLSIAESHFLFYKVHQFDAWNTLKFSNILYSIAVVLLLTHVPEFPPAFKRINTYFIYLIHPHLLKIIGYVCFNYYNLTFYSPLLNLLFVGSFIFLCLAMATLNKQFKKDYLAYKFFFFLSFQAKFFRQLFITILIIICMYLFAKAHSVNGLESNYMVGVKDLKR